VAAPLDLDALAGTFASPEHVVVAELAPLDLDALAELVAIALVAAVVARTWWSRRSTSMRSRRWSPSSPPGKARPGALVVAVLDDAPMTQAVANPVAAELEAALALRRSGADPKALRRALRRIEELLDE